MITYCSQAEKVEVKCYDATLDVLSIITLNFMRG